MTTLGAFNTQLKNLSDNLCELFPQDPDIKNTNNAIHFMVKNNASKLRSVFDEYIPKYKEQIMNKDELFLLECDFVSNDLSQQDVDNSYANIIMNNLKKYWKDMNEESKDNVWKYLQVLIILNDKYKMEKKSF